MYENVFIFNLFLFFNFQIKILQNLQHRNNINVKDQQGKCLCDLLHNEYFNFSYFNYTGLRYIT